MWTVYSCNGSDIVKNCTSVNDTVCTDGEWSTLHTLHYFIVSKYLLHSVDLKSVLSVNCFVKHTVSVLSVSLSHSHIVSKYFAIIIKLLIYSTIIKLIMHTSLTCHSQIWREYNTIVNAFPARFFRTFWNFFLIIIATFTYKKYTIIRQHVTLS